MIDYNTYRNTQYRVTVRTIYYPRRVWAATGIVVVWFVCLFVCDRLAKAKKLVSESAYLDVITVRLQQVVSLVVADLDVSFVVE